jgi:hypothetical protein
MFKYYYNQMPGQKPWRNNLIYTSLVSEDYKTFIQWYFNDGEYHKGQNEVIDPALMDAKWEREVRFLKLMEANAPDLIPKIENIDFNEKKVYLGIDGVDLWQRSLDRQCTFDEVLPDWQEQMLNIIRTYRKLGLYKYSMHPSSYFIVDGKLKSINYFFVYSEGEGPISIEDHSSHIYSTRQAVMRQQVEAMGLSWTEPQTLQKLQLLCFESFRTNYPADFIEKAKDIYRD